MLTRSVVEGFVCMAIDLAARVEGELRTVIQRFEDNGIEYNRGWATRRLKKIAIPSLTLRLGCGATSRPNSIYHRRLFIRCP